MTVYQFVFRTFSKTTKYDLILKKNKDGNEI